MTLKIRRFFFKFPYQEDGNGQVTLGDTEAGALGRSALLEKQADIFIDYTGRVLPLVKGVNQKCPHSFEAVYKAVNKFDKANGLIWLKYAPFSNHYVLVITKEFSEEKNMRTLEDFDRYVNSGEDVGLLTFLPWVKAKTGLPALEKAYGFSLKEEQLSCGLSYAVEVLSSYRVGSFNISTVPSTSTLIDAYDDNILVLKDTKRAYPCVTPSPVIQKATLDKYPEIATILEPIFASITFQEMLQMNIKVEGG